MRSVKAENGSPIAVVPPANEVKYGCMFYRHCAGMKGGGRGRDGEKKRLTIISDVVTLCDDADADTGTDTGQPTSHYRDQYTENPEIVSFALAPRDTSENRFTTGGGGRRDQVMCMNGPLAIRSYPAPEALTFSARSWLRGSRETGRALGVGL